MLLRIRQLALPGLERLRSLRMSSKQFGVAIAVLCIPLLVVDWLVAPLHATGFIALRYVGLGCVLFLVSCFPVTVSSESIVFSIVLPIAIATAYLYGPFGAALISMTSMTATVLCARNGLPRTRKDWREFGWACLHNVPMMAVAVSIPALAYGLLFKYLRFSPHSLEAAAALSVAATCVFYLNAVMLTTLASLWSGARWDVVWYNNYRWTLASTVMLSPLGFIMGALIEQNFAFGVLFILLPLAAIHKGYALHETQIRTYRAGVEMLGKLMQESHPYTHGHLNRVARWAVKIAEEMSLPPESIAHVENAAILHDIGKIAIDDRILNKVEKLTDEEWFKIKQHPVVGAEIAAKMKYLDQVSLWIRHHHERLDGRGYPDGLIDADIPVESKIICVVDAFDAMVGGPSKADQRPYRLPKTMQEAREELIKCSGTQFDEAVVTSFLHILDAEEQEAGAARAAATADSPPRLTLVARSSSGPSSQVLEESDQSPIRLRGAA
jgi:putative nucleotidyltransferase with HDIG domain